MSKLGAHITTGPRNGYGPFVAAKPAVVIGVGEGGALLEAKDKSGGHTITIYRDPTVYLNTPPGMDPMTPAQARAAADFYWPYLVAKWRLNPADYYTILNEAAAHDTAAIATYVAYETRILELAEAEGLRCCVTNLSTGTPDDGRVAGGDSTGGIETWKQFYVPLIARAFAGGHIYGRHAYDQDGIDRAFQEAEYLRSIGLTGGIVITECGLQGGFGYVGDEAWLSWAKELDTELRQHPLIIGACLWTLGDWHGANWQTALPAVTQHIAANPTPKWTPPTPQEPPPTQPGSGRGAPRLQYERYYAVIPTEATLDEATAIFRQNWSASRRTVGGSYDDAGVGDLDTRIAALYGISPDRHGEFAAWYAQHYPGVQVRFFTMEGVEYGLFRLGVPISGDYVITSRFNDPRDYANKKHEGIDFAPRTANAKVLASLDGVVESKGYQATGYGHWIRLRHDVGGLTVRTWYAHMAAASPLATGTNVSRGSVLGNVGSSGNSDGLHVHLTLVVVGQGLMGYAVDDVVDPYPFLDLAAVPVPPTAGAIDLLPYLRGDGRAYMVRHPSGVTEKFRTEQDGSFFYLVKNAQYEAFRYDNSYIWRGADTSPGPAPSYAERPGQLRYYVQREPGQDTARWCKRHMVVGETWQGPGHAVQFYYKSDCSLSAANSGAATNRTRLVAHHASRTWNGIVVPDVVELDGGPGSAERFYFARGFGLVAWASDWGQSAISEVGVTGDNQRERICGLP